MPTIGTHGLVTLYQNYVPIYVPVHITDIRDGYLYVLADDFQPHFLGLETMTRGKWIEANEFIPRNEGASQK